MREIKFRVWDEDGKEIWDMSELYICFLNNGLYISPYDSEIPFEDYKLMQCVGIKDKNGVEIYEGDILEYTFNGETNRDVIVYDGTAFTYKSAFRWSLHQDKIIGNIYENPELLENK